MYARHSAIMLSAVTSVGAVDVRGRKEQWSSMILKKFLMPTGGQSSYLTLSAA